MGTRTKTDRSNTFCWMVSFLLFICTRKHTNTQGVWRGSGVEIECVDAVKMDTPSQTHMQSLRDCHRYSNIHSCVHTLLRCLLVSLSLCHPVYLSLLHTLIHTQPEVFTHLFMLLSCSVVCFSLFHTHTELHIHPLTPTSTNSGLFKVCQSSRPPGS